MKKVIKTLLEKALTAITSFSEGIWISPLSEFLKTHGRQTYRMKSKFVSLNAEPVGI